MLIWLKSYLRESGRKLQLVGIDLPNTLNEDLSAIVPELAAAATAPAPAPAKTTRSRKTPAS
nr:hypothetical protein D3W47_09575 [Deinococcus sp. RM]